MDTPDEKQADTVLVQKLQYNAAQGEKLLQSMKLQLHEIHTNRSSAADTIDSIWYDIGELKLINRNINITADQYKQHITKQKINYDELELKLITKQYQLQYINDQLHDIQSYHTQHQHVSDGMVDEQDYIQQHNIDINKIDKHQLYLQRLNDEFTQRQLLLDELKQLNQQSNQLDRIVQNKQKQLDEIDQHTRLLYQQSQSLAQQILQNDVEYISSDNNAHLLPTPLYTLYCACNTYNILIHGTGFEFSINDTGKLIDDSMCTNDPITIHQLLQPHQLYISIKQQLTDKHYIELNVYYYPLLKFVACDTFVKTKSNKKIVHRYDNILTNLYPHDTGLSSPHNIDSITTAITNATNTIESHLHTYKAFTWLQQLCSINSIPSESNVKYTLTETIQRIIHRFSCYTSLIQQLDQITKHKAVNSIQSIQSYVHTVCQTQISQLTIHKSSTFDATINCTMMYIHPELSNNPIYANIVIAADYPLSIPQFTLSYNTSEDIQVYMKQIEQNINSIQSIPIDRTQLIQLESSNQFSLIAWQIYRLQSLIDRLIAAQHAIQNNENVDQYISSGKDRLLLLGD